jgi:polyhydroxybutyrate depolymerase
MIAVALLLAAALADRPYELRLPKSKKGPLPLVVVLHCFGCPPEEFERWYVEGLADRAGVLVAIPRGHVDKEGRPFWNAAASCCDVDGKGPDDIGYIRAVVEDVKRKHEVDPARVFAYGFSNGGFLAHRLACDAADVFTGVVSIAGTGDAACSAKRPVAVLHIHGDRDSAVPMAGGRSSLGDLGKGPMRPVADVLAFWAKQNGCPGKAERGAALDLVEGIPGDETEVREWRGCKAGLALWTVRGAPHVVRWQRDLPDRALRWLERNRFNP